MSHNLTFGDMMFIVSKIYFIDTIIPKFKNSLSHALKYFPTLAGNCIVPCDLSKPRIQFVEGNSVSLVFAECNVLDFDYLGSSQSRICSEFYPLLPRLSPESMDSGGARKFPVLAVQVTVFPGTGFCIGIEYQHLAADGCAMYGFMKVWAMISKLGEAEPSNNCNNFLLVYDRGVIIDHTKELDDFFWNHLRNTYSEKEMVGIKFPKPHPDKVLSTFVITSDDVQRLKNYVSNRRSSQKRLSTVMIVCGYVWTCLVKQNNVTMNNVDAEETEYLKIKCATTAKNGELSGDDGFLIAVERIGEAIEKRCQEVFEGHKKMFDEYSEKNGGRTFSVAGSPRLDYYKKDFGWGKARKVEIISIDLTGAICFNGSRDGSGVAEIGVGLQREKMEAFSKIFNERLASLSNF
ncbi:hypothetical protein LIER_08046 [Lithospermum erythrorhizon]|uniref:Uncharacterized protein n=1 Tax=Lithospermum erythrorhizon TaxID=34254 RepID=A0AAV3PBG3_LITER